jgi:homoserine dehydrogenase
MADVLDTARSLVLKAPLPWYTADMPVVPMSELVSRYYIRIEVADQPGVLAVIARSFGDHGVSIASVIQKETDGAAQSAGSIMTRTARGDAIQAAWPDGAPAGSP